jgi:glycosyltransferase involved in cell wall biosynthesis
MKPDLPPFGFNLIGHASANAGVGVTLRSLAKTILDQGYPLAILDIDPGHGRAGHDQSLVEYFVTTPMELPYGINISILSITSLPSFIFDYPSLFSEGKLNVGYFWWELSVLPESWKKSLQIFDVLFAGSDFLYATYSQSVEDVFHIRVIPELDFPSGIEADRVKFNIEDDAYVFVCILEPTSDPIRKNPFSAITAFQQAFTGNQKVRLIIKINNSNAFEANDKNLKLLREAAMTDPRISLFTESLSYGDALSLYASCDVYVALHRAEGLGLGLMEAMLLGKPVIATSWSGNMSFMNHTNACLVRYKLVPVEGSLSVYSTQFLGQAACWAEPSIIDAAGWMKALFAKRDLGRLMGSAAKTGINRYLSPESTSVWLDEIRFIWDREKSIMSLSGADKFQDIALLKRHLWTLNDSRWDKIRNYFYALLDSHVMWRFRNNSGDGHGKKK